MITPSFGLTATERVLPRLALDWTTGLTQTGVDVTRAGAATFVGDNGLIQSATADTQRIDYTTGVPGLLVEESRTNLLERSQEFDTTWLLTNVTIGAETESPDGAVNADKVVVDSGVTVSFSAGSAVVRQDINKAASAITYTFSVFGKAAELNGVRLFVRDGATSANNAICGFSLVDGSAVSPSVAGTFTNISTGFKAYANGFYRVWMTFTTGTETALRNFIIPANSTGVVSTGVEGVHIYGAQLEAGAFPTSYIPTEATAVTRNADVATMTGTNFSDWYNQTQGAFVAEYQNVQQQPTNFTRLLEVDGGASNFIRITVFPGGLSVVPNVTTGGAGQLDFMTYSLNDLSRVGFSLKENNFNFSIDAANPSLDTSVAVPTVSSLYLGCSSGGTSQINGLIRKLEYYPVAVIPAETQAFTK